MTPRITLLDGSLGGAEGNTAAAAARLTAHLEPRASVRAVRLRDTSDAGSLASILGDSDGFVFATGTYWDSWGSPMQRFLETATELEGSLVWLGKPAAVVVTMHSVGGKGVLSRLQGVLCTLGLLLPPMSGFVYSLANHLALEGPARDGQEDLWRLDDLAVVAHNLLEALAGGRDFRAWPVDRAEAGRRWI
ncbi:NAD(P)H-dependent oxidoreductase [Polyangium aurulentum]|uniref:NAD(P)H-dependent oxidoreductase n=1 Tax=Polyangium aurulentum TaxID=2567896 RepID=UPI0010ADA8AC|nr:NAD(P)H-dependent oxidoreductase [Polyangium aurulentum]UQA61594.1 NAD(P)H-dependent oxidoreductase [Polyangium aurulentum]